MFAKLTLRVSAKTVRAISVSAASRKIFTTQERVEDMYLPLDKAVLCLQLLVEGNPLRSVEHITGVTMHTLLDLLLTTG
jgi:hypothetical protein